MRTELLLQDPVFQLNILLWMAKEQPPEHFRIRPLFTQLRFSVMYIEQPFRFPDSSVSDGKQHRAAVCVGPEHGTVGPQLVKEAAKEAVQGVGFDLLIVCGFAFDPHVSEEAKRYGKLVVLPTRMNPDLTMGELLKKTGSGNLFMVFGEPDIDVKRQKDGQVAVKLNGLDIYDPTTGEIRSSSTDDIACWFLDTNYNGESFFVRHAYFTGADEPYEKLKRALRATLTRRPGRLSTQRPVARLIHRSPARLPSRSSITMATRF